MKLRIGGTIELETVEDETPSLVFNAKIGGVEVIDISMLILPVDHKVPASIQPVDAAGNPAVVDGVPVWTSSSPEIATVNAAADGLSAEIVPVGPVGSCQINVTADADVGGGITTITGLLDVQTAAGEAVGLQVTTGAPVPIS
jgi:hypothetical protein